LGIPAQRHGFSGITTRFKQGVDVTNMKRLIEATMHRATVIIASLVLILIWGAMSAYQMQREYLPPINNPTLLVTVHARDFHADQVKSSILGPIEESLRKVGGLETFETNSFDGGLLISLYFAMNYDMSRAETDVAYALDRISMSQGVDKPSVTRISTNSFPIMRLSLTSPSGKVDETTLRTTLQSQVTNELKNAAGVSDVHVTGAGTSGYVLTIRMADLKKNGLSIDDVKHSLADIPSTWVQGNITNSQVSIPLQAMGWNQSEQELKQLPLRGGDGHTIPLSAVADLSKSMIDQQTISRTDGAASVVFDVLKTPSSNITEVSKKIHDRIANIPGIEAGDIRLSVLFDQGEKVKSALFGLCKEGLLGCLLSMICVFLFFRNIRSTAIIALSLPVCLMATTGVLHTMGISLNLLTVSGLIVAMGRVIDDTIVILDNIYRRANQTAAKLNSGMLAEAVMEMIPAVVSSTATTVAVYIPIAIIGGMISSAFSGFAWSVVIALVTSLLVAMFVAPAFYYIWHKGRMTDSAVSIEPFSYKTLSWAFERKKRFIASFIFIFLIAGIGAFFLPVNFLPANRSGQINVQLEFPDGTSVTQVDATVKRMEQTLKSNSDITTFSSVVGSSFTPQFDDVFDAGGGWIQGDNVANIAVSIKNAADVTTATAMIEKQLADISGSAICTVTNQNIAGDDSQFKINLSGADAATLDNTAKLIRSKLSSVNGLSVVGAANDKEALPKFQLSLNREALERAGVKPDEVYTRIREYLSEGSKFEVKSQNQETIPFVIHTDMLNNIAGSSAMTEPQTQILTLMGTEIFIGKDGRNVRLDEIASLGPVSAPSIIRQHEGRPFSVVTANITTRDIERVSRQVKDTLQQLALPPGVQYSMNGITAQVNQMIYEMGMALSVSVLLVLVILSSVFRGWRTPMSVLLCIPFAFIGSIAGMLVSGGEWNLASLVGLLMLAGIVVTNGIVLVDKIERHLATGMKTQEAVLKGTASRVRPVLMTAVTTILTLLPLCFSASSDTIVSQSLGVVVVCGMISSTLISLLAIPMLYEWLQGRSTVTHAAGSFRMKKSAAG
jgi:multidrug efflux pump subunit AcrB